MKVSVLALTGTTLALALTCATLIQQLQAERRHAQAEATLRRQWEDRFRELVPARPAPLPISPLPPTNAPGAQQDHASPLHRDDGRPPDSWWSRFLDRLATRDGHAQLLAEQLVHVRRNNPDLAKELHLTHDEESQVLAAEAEQMLKGQARMARCRMDPACDPKSVWSYGEKEKNPVRDLLGAEKFAEYEQYQKTVSDRLQVRELRSRLDAANGLGDEQAEALVAAMRDERAQFETEAQETGRSMTYFGSPIGAVMAASQASGSEPPSDAEVLDSAQDFASRLRKRAADVLTAEQMRQFVAIQDEQLTQVKMALRQRADARASGQ